LRQRAAETGDYIMDALSEMQARHPSIGDVRGRGLMIGTEFVTDKQAKTRAPALRDDIIQAGFEAGLLVIPCGGNSIRFTPPLNIPRELVDEGLALFESAVAKAERRHL
jgi:4-aminobutyrate aminotransferase